MNPPDPEPWLALAAHFAQATLDLPSQSQVQKYNPLFPTNPQADLKSRAHDIHKAWSVEYKGHYEACLSAYIEYTQSGQYPNMLPQVAFWTRAMLQTVSRFLRLLVSSNGGQHSTIFAAQMSEDAMKQWLLTTWWMSAGLRQLSHEIALGGLAEHTFGQS